MLDLVLFHPIPAAMATVMILWALADALTARRHKLAPVPVRVRNSRMRGR